MSAPPPFVGFLSGSGASCSSAAAPDSSLTLIFGWKNECFSYSRFSVSHNSDDDDADHGGRRGKEEENEDRFWRRHAASDFLSDIEIGLLIACKEGISDHVLSVSLVEEKNM